MWEIIVAKIALIAPYAGTFGGYFAGAFMFIKWWFDKKRGDETTSLSRIETLSKVEERLRQSLEKQLAVTEAKLELANKEVERLKLLVASHAIEVEKLKAELAIEIAKNKRE